MANLINYLLIPFEGNISPGDPTGIKLYLQATMEIYKETDNIYISVPNYKNIIDPFLSLVNNNGWGHL